MEVTDRPDLVLQIVPSGVGAYPGLAGGFLILGFDGREAVYVDDAFSGDIIEAVEEIATMKRVWEALRVEALPGKQSVDLPAKWRSNGPDQRNLVEVVPQRKQRRHVRRGHLRPSGRRPTMTGAGWRKSSHSGTGETCVEVSWIDSDQA
jgi:hypothetical protein